jgi:hypothetical protein
MVNCNNMRDIDVLYKWPILEVFLLLENSQKERGLYRFCKREVPVLYWLIMS